MTTGIDLVDRRIARTLGVAVAAFLLLTFHGFVNLTDGRSMYEVTTSIVEDGDLTIVEGPLVSVEGRDGEPYSKYGIGLPLLSIPFYLAGWAVSLVAGEKRFLTQLFVTALMPVAYGFLAAASYRLARRLGGGPQSSLLAAVGAIFGTFLLAYAQEFFSEPVVALLLVVALERLLAGRPVPAGAALALAVVVRPQTAVVVPLYLVACWSRHRLAGALRLVAPLIAGAAVIALYNVARFADATSTGYEGEGFTTPFFEGAEGLLFDRTKSVLLFAPVVVLLAPAVVRLWRTQREAAVVIGGTALAVFVSTALWHSWPGGFSWGPRLLIPAMPLGVCALAPWVEGSAARWRVTTVLLVLGFVASASSILVPTTAQLVLPADLGTGPSIVGQYELVDDVVENTADGECPGAHNLEFLPDERHCMVALWQVEVVRRFDGAGWAAAAAVSAALLVTGGGAIRDAARGARSFEHGDAGTGR